MKKIICLDAEFAILEVLELSIFADDLLPTGEGSAREVFHSLFRPVSERRWPGSQRVHHISPAMVRNAPYFRRRQAEIQRLIDESDCLVGFAIDNDLDALRREGISIDESKPVIDVRDLHWLLHGRAAGVELDARKGLAVTASELGIPFDDADAHGAKYDTQKTLECFRELMSRFADECGDVAPDSLLELYFERWNREREEYLEAFAHGWVSITETREGYRLRASRLGPPSDDRTVATIEVNARWRALNEIDAHFDRKRHRDHPSLYLLTAADIEWFKNYTNTYDASEPMHRRLQDLRVAASRR